MFYSKLFPQFVGIFVVIRWCECHWRSTNWLDPPETWNLPNISWLAYSQYSYKLQNDKPLPKEKWADLSANFHSLYTPQNKLLLAVLQFCHKIHTSRLRGVLDEMSAFSCVPPLWYILMIRNWQWEPTSSGLKKGKQGKRKLSIYKNILLKCNKSCHVSCHHFQIVIAVLYEVLIF